jgi:serine/threonine protein phosphatase PrpC
MGGERGGGYREGSEGLFAGSPEQPRRPAPEAPRNPELRTADVRKIYAEVQPTVLRTQRGPIGFAANIGLGRGEQQDRLAVSVSVDPETGVNFCACIDGMGGQAEGGKAAQILAGEWLKSAGTSWDASTGQGVHRAAQEQMQSAGVPEGGGACYLAIKLFEDASGRKTVRGFRAGDVRWVLFKKDGTVSASIDEGNDSGVFNAVQVGATPEDLGTATPFDFEVENGDRLLLATDGLTKISDKQGSNSLGGNAVLERMIQGKATLDAVQTLLSYAIQQMQRGANRDNVSFFIWDIQGGNPASAVGGTAGAGRVAPTRTPDSLPIGLDRRVKFTPQPKEPKRWPTWKKALATGAALAAAGIGGLYEISNGKSADHSSDSSTEQVQTKRQSRQARQDGKKTSPPTVHQQQHHHQPGSATVRPSFPKHTAAPEQRPATSKKHQSKKHPTEPKKR